MLSVRDIAYSHPNVTAPVLAGCSLCVHPGEIVAVLGGRGTGKTTLARIVAGIVEGFEGEVAFGRRRREEADVVLVAEDTLRRFATDIVSDEVAHRLGECGIVEPVVSRRVREALSLVGISHLADVKTRSLSHVEAMLVSLACTVAVRPRYVVLDGVDALSDVVSGDGSELLRRVLEEMRQRGSHVLVMTRRLTVALLADKCGVLYGSRIVWSGEPTTIVDQDVLCDVARISAYERRLLRQPDRLPPLGDATPAAASAEGRALVMKDVSLKRSGIRILEHVDLQLRPGRVALVAGRAGDGKTSVSLVASALADADAGAVSFGGAKVRLGSVGLLHEDATRAFLVDTIARDMTCFLRSCGVDEAAVPGRAKAMLAEVGLGEDIWERPVRELSAGELRLVGLACMLNAGFEALVLDEPTDGLDGADADRVRDLVARCARRGVAIAVTSRDPLSWLAHVEDVTFLREGAVVFSGTKDECVSSAMPWVKAGLAVPRWLFDPQPPLGAEWGSTEGRSQLVQESGLREPETASAGRYGQTADADSNEDAAGVTRAYAGAPKGSRRTGRRTASVLRMRAARPHARGRDAQARTTLGLMAWAAVLGVMVVALPWPALPIMALCVGATCAFCHMGVRDVVRLCIASVPVLVVVFLLAFLMYGAEPSRGLFATLSAGVRLELVVWLVAAVARVSTPTDVARFVCAPLGLLRGLGADVDGWELSLARRLRYASLYVHELQVALMCRRMREGVNRGLGRGEREVSLGELRALARERAEQGMA